MLLHSLAPLFLSTVRGTWVDGFNEDGEPLGGHAHELGLCGGGGRVGEPLEDQPRDGLTRFRVDQVLLVIPAVFGLVSDRFLG